MIKRLEVFDYIRVIATLAVIMIHAASGFVLKSDVAYVLNQVSRFTIPIFIILSGAMLYFSSIGKQEKIINYVSFIKRRTKKIIIPFVIITLMYMVIDYRTNINGILALNFWQEFFKNLIVGKNHLYFIVIIFQFYMLYPFIYKVYESSKRNVLIWISFAVTLYFQVAIYLIFFNIYILPKGLISISYLLFPTWIYFFVYGMDFIKNLNERKTISIWIKLITWIVAMILLIADSKLTNSYELSTKPTVILYALVSFEFFYDIFNILNNKAIQSINKLVTWFSKQSFAIYLFHILVLDCTKILLQKVHFDNLLTSNKGVAILFFMDLLLTTLLVYLLSFVPYTEMLGVEKRSSKG